MTVAGSFALVTAALGHRPGHCPGRLMKLPATKPATRGVGLAGWLALRRSED